MEKRKPITVAEAVRKVMNAAGEGKREAVSIDQAYGRRLAQDVVSTHPVPPFNRSPYDGFAIRAEDSKLASRENPVTFRVVGEIGAGQVFTGTLQEREAVRIMTGAQIPDDCDAIVMFELTAEHSEGGESFMTIKRPFASGDNVSFAGEDTEAGKVLVPKGSYINPGVMALLATFGYHSVEVAQKPVVGVFATGSELLDVHEELQPGKIRNSNAHMILAQIERAGAEPLYLGKLPDQLDRCLSAVREALPQVDMLITTGGVSVGDYDLLPDVYKEIGAEVLFNKVAMRPGSVTTVAKTKEKLLFGLSGNPSACYVGFELFVRPVISHRFFDQKPHLKKAKAVLAEDFLKPNPFTRFVRSTLDIKDGCLHVDPSGFNKSNAVAVLAYTDVLMVLPGGTRGFRTGDMVDVLILDAHEGSEWPWD
ncbi:gephyrin-like molybdotransferase Glp [Bacillus thermotolerans]|uniref:molybdopterin molybdotransferase MoeA n=1 Tax=Bacillus thermotolerans TaxID=1221996 RepID=UPI000589116B|nr:gephyrin-like molybdotransferase Glp [Bacillus thermotolerans]KKB36827.1 Molybdopterin biosynthesis protein MoeA [Bacillus thermotolerans]